MLPNNVQHLAYILTDGPHALWKTHARNGYKIDAIKAMRTQYGVGLYEGKNLVEEYNLDPNHYDTVPQSAYIISLGDTASIRITILANGSKLIEKVTKAKVVTSDHDLFQTIANFSKE